MPPAELATFLRGEIDAADFRHVDHVRMGYAILAGRPFHGAAASFAKALQAMAARAGHASAYHETITLAFLALIAERRAAQPSGDFDAFAAANPDLTDKTALVRWYGPEKLGTPLARATFVLPDPRR